MLLCSCRHLHHHADRLQSAAGAFYRATLLGFHYGTNPAHKENCSYESYSNLRSAAAVDKSGGHHGFVLCASTMIEAAEPKPIDTIEDNSFLIEEAYNQEPEVVQHIFNAVYNNDSRRRRWTFNFTQEWPVFSQDHQFSYTIPSYHLVEGSDRVYGLGDIQLNYRTKRSKKRV
jgi:hypothetical protein